MNACKMIDIGNIQATLNNIGVKQASIELKLRRKGG